jgi:hypothetical protein
MADLPEVSSPERKAEIDTVGWLFLAIAVVITGTAAMIAYEANDTCLRPCVTRSSALGIMLPH